MSKTVYKLNVKRLIVFLVSFAIFIGIIYFMPRYQYNQQFYDLIHPVKTAPVKQ